MAVAYSFQLVVDDLDLDDGALLDALADAGYRASQVNGLPLVRVEAEDANPRRAAVFAIDEIESLGLRVSSILTDLVSVSDIAMRLDVNRETARLWTTGQRRADFPPPFSAAGGSDVWDWADVFTWAKDANLNVNWLYETPPLPRDARHMVNGRLARERVTNASQWGYASRIVREKESLVVSPTSRARYQYSGDAA